MSARRRTVPLLVWLTVLTLVASTSAPAPAAAQAMPRRPWRDPLLEREPFADGYLQALDRRAAEAMLVEDPLSVDAATLLLLAGRTEQGLDVFERVVRGRPECSWAVLFSSEYRNEPFITDERSRAITARAKAVADLARRASDALKASGSNATCQAHRGSGATSTDADGPVAPRLLDAQLEITQAGDALLKRGSWSIRSVERALAPGVAVLREVADHDRGRDGQWALAELARVTFGAGQLKKALDFYTALEARYPEAETAWVAAMRAAQLIQSQGEPETAAVRFANIGRTYGSRPTVVALAALYEARAWEDASRLDDALTAYRAALSAWPPDVQVRQGLDWLVRYFANARAEPLWPQFITRHSMEERVAALTEAKSGDGLFRINRATWLLDHSRTSEAASLVRASLEVESDPGHLTTLRRLQHRATFDEAIATMSRSGRLAGSAKGALRRLCSDAFDTWVGMGCAIHASRLAVDGHRSEADAVLRRALTTWSGESASRTRLVGAADNLPATTAREALAVRDAVFVASRLRGKDHGPHQQLLSAPFLIMPDSVSVMTADGGTGSVGLTAPSGSSRAVVVPARSARQLWQTVEWLSGCDNGRRSRRLDELWNATVGFAPWYCSLGGTWFTPPVVGSIEFTNAEETRARVEIGYDVGGGGRTVIVEKEHGEWRVTTTEAQWEY